METVMYSFVKKIIRLVKHSDAQNTLSHKDARKIMGKNFYGIEEAIRHYHLKPTVQQLAALQKIPFSKATLQECKDTHILIAVFPISIHELKNFYDVPVLIEGGWRGEKEFFLDDKGILQWQLIRKTAIENTANKTWVEQQSLLSNKEIVPTARIMVYTIWSHYIATSSKKKLGEKLFEALSSAEQMEARCSDTKSNGYRVTVGNFYAAIDGVGFCVSYYRDDKSYGHIGLASTRKCD